LAFFNYEEADKMKEAVLFQQLYEMAALLAKANQEFCQNWLGKKPKAPPRSDDHEIKP
jgi:hypothetical protein